MVAIFQSRSLAEQVRLHETFSINYKYAKLFVIGTGERDEHPFCWFSKNQLAHRDESTPTFKTNINTTSS